jgi:hypothetical protein
MGFFTKFGDGAADILPLAGLKPLHPDSCRRGSAGRGKGRKFSRRIRPCNDRLCSRPVQVLRRNHFRCRSGRECSLGGGRRI